MNDNEILAAAICIIGIIIMFILAILYDDKYLHRRDK